MIENCMETNNNQKQIIDLKKIITLLWSKKKTFVKVWVITFILSCVWILPQPRYYVCEMMLAPETSDDNAMGGVGALASSFGLSLGGGSDAIYPELYPDLMSSTDFVVSLFDIPVVSLDGTINTDLYNYENKCQKTAFYNKPKSWIKKKIKSIFSHKKEVVKDYKDINPFMLTERETDVVNKMRGDINCTVDKLTGVFVIKSKAQDPLIAATLTDSVCHRLQDAIIKYRTNKARIDVEHYEKLVKEAKEDYANSQRKYGLFCDTHKGAQLQTVLSRKDELENEMQLSYNIYTTLIASLQNARAKLQERTPAFTVIQNVSVPVKPAGPKRIFFVAFMLVLASFVTGLYFLRDDFKKTILFFS